MNKDSIPKAILSVVTEDWQTLPELQEKVCQKLGIPSSNQTLEDLVPLYAEWLVGKDRLEVKQVPVPQGGYYYMCRKRQKEVIPE